MLGPILISVGLLAAACGGESNVTDTGIATLEDTTAIDTSGVDTESVEKVSADEAALNLSACIRDAGFDIPDIGLDADGNPDIRGAIQSGNFNFGDDGFREAMQSCAETVEGVAFGGNGARAGIADNTELQDAAIEFSACIREEGFDVGDLTLGGQGGPGTNADADGDAPAAGERGEGDRQQGFGDANSQWAALLGLDGEDPTVIAAIETCGSIMEDAFTDAGVGQRGQNG